MTVTIVRHERVLSIASLWLKPNSFGTNMYPLLFHTLCGCPDFIVCRETIPRWQTWFLFVAALIASWVINDGWCTVYFDYKEYGYAWLIIQVPFVFIWQVSHTILGRPDQHWSFSFHATFRTLMGKYSYWVQIVWPWGADRPQFTLKLHKGAIQKGRPKSGGRGGSAQRGQSKATFIVSMTS